MPLLTAWMSGSGELKIAEVASRFTNQDEFVSYICSFGFRLKTKVCLPCSINVTE